MSTERVSIWHEVDGQDLVGDGAYRVLETFDSAADTDATPFSKHIRRQMQRALQDFPELVGEVVTVARLRPDDLENGTNARAGMLNRIVYVPTERPTSFATIYHELGHLAIQIRDERGEDVPTTSEEYCSIFSVARMPPELVDEEYIAYLGSPRVPQEKWPNICQQALEYRENHRNYIQQCKKWLGVDSAGGERT